MESVPPETAQRTLQPDGSIVLLLTEDRDDNSAMELVAFRLTGF